MPSAREFIHTCVGLSVERGAHTGSMSQNACGCPPASVPAQKWYSGGQWGLLMQHSPPPFGQ
eukprot:7106343-Prymnesium_polylepis.1